MRHAMGAVRTVVVLVAALWASAAWAEGDTIKHRHRRAIPSSDAWFLRLNMGGGPMGTTGRFDPACGQVDLFGRGSDWQVAIGGRPADWAALHLSMWGQGSDDVTRRVDGGMGTGGAGGLGWAAAGPGLTLTADRPRFWVSSSVGVAVIGGSALPYAAAVGPALDGRVAKEWPLRRWVEGIGIYGGLSMFGLPLQRVGEPLGGQPVYMQWGGGASLGLSITVL